MPKDPDLSRLEERRDALKEEMSSVGDLRPGSLTERYRKCGKPTCHCAAPGSKGHGPSYSLTRQVKGRTVTRVIPAGEAVEQTRRQIAEHRRFRELSRRFVEVSERICQARLEASPSGSESGPQKRGSGKRSGRKSARRPRHS